MASGIFSRLVSRFNSFSSALALSILLSLLSCVYNFAFPKVTKILVLGGFSIKWRGFDPLCKTWFACFTSPLCNLSAERQINIQLITASSLKSWSNQFKLKYNFRYYPVLLPTLIYQNSYIYMSDAERRWSQKSGLLICIIIFEHFLIRDAFCISIDDFQLQWYVCSVFVINKLLWIFFHSAVWMCFHLYKKSIVTEVPENVLGLSVLSDFIFLENTWKPWVSEGISLLCYSGLTTLCYSGLHLHTGMEEHCQNAYLWLLDKCSCSVCQWRARPILGSSIFFCNWLICACK